MACCKYRSKLPVTRQKNMNVLITGASRGLGKAMVEMFAKHGHNLAMVSKQENPLKLAVEDIKERYPGNTYHAEAFDLRNKEQAIQCGKWALEKMNTLDVLINNAGFFLPGDIHNEADGVLEEMMESNIYSAYHLTRSILPSMMERKAGHIFNICSVASLDAYPQGGSYSISKFALLGFSKNLREELKTYGIRVTSVIPGATWTDSWADSGVEEQRLMEAKDLARMVYSASQLGPRSVVEEIILRPQLGDL
jgi:short-subunit dehydrogenase